MRSSRILAGVAAATLAFAMSSAAFAKKPEGAGPSPSSDPTFEMGTTLCTLGDISPGATACAGWFVGNLNSGNSDAKDASAAALNSLLGGSAFSGATLTWLENFDVSGNTVNFATDLFGQTVVAFHVGGAVGQPTGVGYQSSAFYVFDAGSTGLDTFTVNVAGLSNARLYSTGSDPCASTGCVVGVVPEPAAWLLMILGFGGAGAMLRRRRHALA